MHRWGLFSGIAAIAAFVVAIVSSLPAIAAGTQISSDPYANTSSFHKTQVEPDSFAYGSTIVDAFQSGRFSNGGSSDVGWARSGDAGATWSTGFLPGTTTLATPPGAYSRVSDPSVAYDAKYATWLVTTLALSGTTGTGVLASRSTDDGVTFSSPVVVRSQPAGNVDKDWVVCDNTSTSPYYGNCYAEWDDNGAGNVIYMSTSTNGGATWSAPRKTANAATGLGGQPVVQPSGRVVVPIDNAYESAVRSFISADGGRTWGTTVKIAAIKDHTVAGSLRAGPLVSAEVDGDGKVYVVWQDCRFRSNCKQNDIVMATSVDGVTWSSTTRVPIDDTASRVDHFLPGIGVDPATSGATAHLAITYYYYPASACTVSTCQLGVGSVASPDGGSTWSPPAFFAGPMSVASLPNTTEGYMVGDYFSTSFVKGQAFGVFAVANPKPTTMTYSESMYTAPIGSTGAATATVAGQPVPAAQSDHAEAKQAKKQR